MTTDSPDQPSSVLSIQDMLTQLITAHCIVDVKSGHDLETDWMLDMHSLLMHPETLSLLADCFWDCYEDQLPFQIAGVETAALPLITAIMMRGKERSLQTSSFFLRKQRTSEGGPAVLIEGDMNDDPVILVDDFCFTGKTLGWAHAILTKEERKIMRAFVIVDCQTELSQDWQKDKNIPVDFLLTAQDLGRKAPEALSPSYFSYAGSQKKYHYEIAWRFFLPGAFPFHVVPKSAPLLVKDKLYVGTDSGSMVCLNPETGDMIWQYQTPSHGTSRRRKGIRSHPVYHHGHIYFGCSNGNIYCLNAGNGMLVWSNAAAERVRSTPVIIPDHGLICFALEYERARQKGSHAAYNLSDGQPVWESGFQAQQNGGGVYWEGDDYVIYGASDHSLIAHHAKTGEKIWECGTKKGIREAPALDTRREVVVAASLDGMITAAQASTGERLATIQTDDLCLGSPLIVKDKIFVGSGDKHLYVIDANTYKPLDKIYCGARIFSTPTILGDHILFGTNGGYVFEMDIASHAFVGRTQIPDAITNPVISTRSGDFVYAVTHMNEVFGLKRIKT